MATGIAASITFNALTLNPTLGGARVYTLGAGSITSVAVNGDFDIVPPNVAGAVRSLSVVRGTVTSLTVGGRTRVVALGAGNDSTSLDTTGMTSFTSGTLVLGDAAGGTGTNTLTAGAAAITLNGAAGPLFTRNANGVFTAGTSTVTMNSAASVALTAGTFLTTNAFDSLTVTMPGQTGTLGADITVNDTLMLTSGTFSVGANLLTLNGPTIAGTPTNLSTTSSSSLTFGGASAGVNLPSSVTNLNNLTVNNANGLALNSSPAVAGTLTLTNGVVVAGTNTLTTSANCPGSIVRTNGWVSGNLGMAFPLAGPPNCTFHLGDVATNYTPLQLNFSSVTTAGSLTAGATGTDHPNTTAGTSGISSGVSINRYWALKDSTMAGTATVTFNYIGGIPVDNDSATTPTRIRRATNCTGIDSSRTCAPWSSLTVSGAPTSTQAIATGVALAVGATAQSDFAVGGLDPTTNFLRERQFIYTRELY